MAVYNSMSDQTPGRSLLKNIGSAYQGNGAGTMALFDSANQAAIGNPVNSIVSGLLGDFSKGNTSSSAKGGMNLADVARFQQYQQGANQAAGLFGNNMANMTAEQQQLVRDQTAGRQANLAGFGEDQKKFIEMSGQAAGNTNQMKLKQMGLGDTTRAIGQGETDRYATMRAMADLNNNQMLAQDSLLGQQMNELLGAGRENIGMQFGIGGTQQGLANQLPNQLLAKSEQGSTSSKTKEGSGLMSLFA
jgi:hypothetical protein